MLHLYLLIELYLVIDEYATGLDFKEVMSAIGLGKKEEPFHVQNGYLL